MLCTLPVNYLLMTMVSPLNAFSYFNLADGLRAYLRVVLLGLESSKALDLSQTWLLVYPSCINTSEI